MLRVLRGELFALCHFEVGEVEAGGDGAADKRVGVGLTQRGSEPAACGHNGLELFALIDVAAEQKLLIVAAGLDDVDDEAGAGVEVPDSSERRRWKAEN